MPRAFRLPEIHFYGIEALLLILVFENLKIGSNTLLRPSRSLSRNSAQAETIRGLTGDIWNYCAKVRPEGGRKGPAAGRIGAQGGVPGMRLSLRMSILTGRFGPFSRRPSRPCPKGRIMLRGSPSRGAPASPSRNPSPPPS